MDYQELIEQLRDTNKHTFALWFDAADAIESLLNALDVAEGEVKRTAAERDAPVVAYRHLMEDGWEYFDAPTGDDCPKCVPLIVKPGENI